MPERVQPGAEVSKDSYERFKEMVENKHGAIRGNLGKELERAMENHMSEERGPDRLERIESDLAHIKRVVAESEADGGDVLDPTPTPSEPDRTHTHAERHTSDTNTDDERTSASTPVEKPAPNAPRAKKVEYLLDTFRSKFGTESDGLDHTAVHPAAVGKLIRREFEFGDRTVEDYRERVIDALREEVELVDHPDPDDDRLVGVAECERIQQERREAAEHATDDEEDRLGQAERS